MCNPHLPLLPIISLLFITAAQTPAHHPLNFVRFPMRHIAADDNRFIPPLLCIANFALLRPHHFPGRGRGHFKKPVVREKNNRHRPRDDQTEHNIKSNHVHRIVCPARVIQYPIIATPKPATDGTLSRMSDSTAGLPHYLDIRSAEGVHQRVDLQGGAMIIGRAADAQVILESTTVSRQHAKLVRDERGRWRIHDLNSRNGTSVNGHLIKEQSLSPGDQIQIGSFQLTLTVPQSFRPASAPLPLTYNTTVHVSDDEGRLSTLKDMEPPRVAASHLTTLNELSQKLLVTADPLLRSLELCRLMISRQFHGEWAMLLRVQPTAPNQPPEILCEPQRGSAAAPQDQPHVSRSLLRTVAQQGEAVLASNVQSVAAMPANVEMSIAASVKALAAVACPLRKDQRGLELLYLRHSSAAIWHRRMACPGIPGRQAISAGRRSLGGPRPRCEPCRP